MVLLWLAVDNTLAELSIAMVMLGSYRVKQVKYSGYARPISYVTRLHAGTFKASSILHRMTIVWGRTTKLSNADRVKPSAADAKQHNKLTTYCLATHVSRSPSTFHTLPRQSYKCNSILVHGKRTTFVRTDFEATKTAPQNTTFHAIYRLAPRPAQ
jgi:hypothetical protein